MQKKERYYYNHAVACRASSGLEITVQIDHGFSLRQVVRLRLAGIGLVEAAEENPEIAGKAATYLGNLLYGKRLSLGVELACRHPREYEAWVTTEMGVEVNEAMVAAGFAEWVEPYTEEAMMMALMNTQH